MPKRLPSPKPYQKKITKRVVNDEALAIHAGMGLGKTRAVLEGLQKLLKKKRQFKKVLVVSTIPVVESTWPDEIKKWKIKLKYQLIRSKKPAERIAQMNTDADIYAINFEMLYWLARPQHRKWFKELDILVIDELTKCKSTKSTPYRVFKNRRHWFKKRIGMTGTMLPESYVDLYGQMTVLTKVWDTKIEFLEKHFIDESRDPRYSKYELKNKKAKKKIQKAVRPHIITLDNKDYLDVPEWSIQDYWFDLSPKQRRYYDEFEREMFLELGDDVDVLENFMASNAEEDETEVVADTASAMRLKLRQIISGFLYNEDKEALVFDTTKLDFTKKILDEIDENVLVMYGLVEEKRQVAETFDSMLLKGKESVKRWNKGKQRYAHGHPLSMGHGLNLQDGGRIMLWYSLPRPYEQYAQAIARLIRTGQSENVIIIRVLARDTLDELIIDDLTRKENGQEGFVNALKAYRNRRAGRER